MRPATCKRRQNQPVSNRSLADIRRTLDVHSVGRIQIILLTVGAAIAALVAESYLGSSHYKINGVTYAVPHKYEFMRNFSLPWLDAVKGLDREPDQSVWMLFPAEQLAQGIPGYKRWFHGYSDQYEADIVVNVLGGKEAYEFPGDRSADIVKVAQQLDKQSPQRFDPTTGWNRVYWMVGQKGTPGEGNDLFYLIPRAGLKYLPTDWRVPSCQSSPDINGRETFTCLLTIYRRGLTFGFYVRQENFGVANRIPNYSWARLNTWRS